MTAPTAKVNERIELHRFPYDRQVVKLKVEISAQNVKPCPKEIFTPDKYQENPCVSIAAAMVVSQ